MPTRTALAAIADFLEHLRSKGYAEETRRVRGTFLTELLEHAQNADGATTELTAGELMEAPRALAWLTDAAAGLTRRRSTLSGPSARSAAASDRVRIITFNTFAEYLGTPARIEVPPNTTGEHLDPDEAHRIVHRLAVERRGAHAAVAVRTAALAASSPRPAPPSPSSTPTTSSSSATRPASSSTAALTPCPPPPPASSAGGCAGALASPPPPSRAPTPDTSGFPPPTGARPSTAKTSPSACAPQWYAPCTPPTAASSSTSSAAPYGPAPSAPSPRRRPPPRRRGTRVGCPPPTSARRGTR
ncbi:hypothetical protein ACF067_28040 [Streptomyces albidoflavus]